MPKSSVRNVSRHTIRVIIVISKHILEQKFSRKAMLIKYVQNKQIRICSYNFNVGVEKKSISFDGIDFTDSIKREMISSSLRRNTHIHRYSYIYSHRTLHYDEGTSPDYDDIAVRSKFGRRNEEKKSTEKRGKKFHLCRSPTTINIGKAYD